MKRTKDLNIGLLASVAAATLAMSGCGGPARPNAIARRCVDDGSVIVEDRYCEDEDRRGPVSTGSYYPYRWYYGGPSGYLPVGQQVGGGSIDPPAGVSSFSHPTSGGTVRGVFGGSAAGSDAGSAGE